VGVIVSKGKARTIRTSIHFLAGLENTQHERYG